MTTLFRIDNGRLRRIARQPLSNEQLIQDWVADDPALLGLDAIIIGREVHTGHGYIDLLGIDRAGSLVVIELKKDRTPRVIVGQILDYASWATTLNTAEIHDIAESYTGTRLATLFQDRFDERLPDRLNGGHSLVIVASVLDDASKRIVEYLSEEHGLAINTVFFNVFGEAGNEWLTTDFLLDQEAVEERSERKVRPPWSGFYFVNAGLSDYRSWTDMQRYGYVQAGGGSFYSGRLDQLDPSDKLFLYHKGAGYIGYGLVTTEKTLASEFETPNGPLFDQPLEGDAIRERSDDPELAEYVVGVNWLKTYPVEEARFFKGAFANQNIVCKLRDPATVDFLLDQFEVDQLG